jgi:hypothetical protein
VVRLGVDIACEDGGIVGPLSVHWCGGVCFWVHPSGLVFREGVDVVLKDSTGDAGGARVALEVVVNIFASSWWW